MPRYNHRFFPLPPVTCYCGRVFENTGMRARHLRACRVWKTFSPVQKQEHKDRLKLLAVLRCHNHWRARFEQAMDELVQQSCSTAEL